jgi:hypothetical protein
MTRILCVIFWIFLHKLYKLQTTMQVVQTSFNAISLNASCFLIDMSSLELHNVDTFFSFFFLPCDLFQATQAMQAGYLSALPTKARILCLDSL